MYIAVVSVAKWPRPVHIFAGGDPKRVTSKEGNRLCKVTDVALPFDLLQGNQVIFGSISHSSLVCSSSGFVFCLFSPDVRIVSHRKKCVIIDPHFRKWFGNNNPLRYKEGKRGTKGHESTLVHDKVQSWHMSWFKKLVDKGFFVAVGQSNVPAQSEGTAWLPDPIINGACNQNVTRKPTPLPRCVSKFTDFHCPLEGDKKKSHVVANVFVCISTPA